MKFYIGEEDIRYVIEGYARIGKNLVIRYMDGSGKIIVDERGEYEKLLREKMIEQLRERNSNFDVRGTYNRVFIDSLAVASVYFSLAACLLKGEGDVNGIVYLSSFALGAWGMGRNISNTGMIKDIKKTNMFLKVFDSGIEYDGIDINCIDDVSYSKMKRVYRKVLK